MRPHRFVVVGGGVSAWVTMAALAHAYVDPSVEIVHLDTGLALDEPQIADSCQASVRRFHANMRISERELMLKAQATFKLGICYKNWSRLGKDFFHAVGDYGNMLDGIDFHQYTMLLQQCGDETPFDTYSLAAHSAKAGKFGFLGKDLIEKGLNLDYTLHVDLMQYGLLMQNVAHEKPIKVIRGQINKLIFDNKNQDIRALSLISGELVEGEFFLDCSGASGLIISRLCDDNFIDWSSTLPVNKQIDFLTDTSSASGLYSTLAPHACGWVKSIPLRNKTLHSWVYNNNFLADSDAQNIACAFLGIPSVNGSVCDIKPGRRKNFWVKNCIAIGASAGNFSNIALSYLHHIQSGVLRFIELYSIAGENCFAATEYNQLIASEYANILDYHRLNLLLCSSQDSDFWRNIMHGSCSKNLEHKISLFKKCGKLAFYEYETWLPSAWISLFLGCDYWPEKHDALLNGMQLEAIVSQLNNVKSMYANLAEQMPSAESFLSRYTSSN